MWQEGNLLIGLTPSSRSRIVAEGGEDKESDTMELLLFKGGGG